MLVTRFGFWPRPWEIKTDAFRVVPVAAHAEIVGNINRSSRSFQGWIYPPLESVSHSSTVAPQMPTKAYQLPCTHELTSHTDDAGLANFTIAMIGLLDGMRLTPDGWNHFYKATIEPSNLVDFYCHRTEMPKAIDLAINWWHRMDKELQGRMFGAIHWYCFTASYEHDFERFGGLYTVLDALYSIHVSQGGAPAPRHSERAATLAVAYGVPVPSWAVGQEKTCVLSRLRNEFIHEARYAGEPIGFAFPKDSITLELSAFLTRLILAMLNIECRYSQSLVTTRQMHGLDLL